MQITKILHNQKLNHREDDKMQKKKKKSMYNLV